MTASDSVAKWTGKLTLYCTVLRYSEGDLRVLLRHTCMSAQTVTGCSRWEGLALEMEAPFIRVCSIVDVEG